MWIWVKLLIFVIKLTLLQNYTHFTIIDRYFIKTHTNITIFNTFNETVPLLDLRISSLKDRVYGSFLVGRMEKICVFHHLVWLEGWKKKKTNNLLTSISHTLTFFLSNLERKFCGLRWKLPGGPHQPHQHHKEPAKVAFWLIPNNSERREREREGEEENWKRRGLN